MLSESTNTRTEKSFLIKANYGLFLVDSLRPQTELKTLNLPSSRQCVGTNRLWGANLGAAAHIDLASKKIDKKDLIDIAVLSRSFLVVEDHIKDEHILKDTLDYCSEWLDNISNVLHVLYDRIEEDFETHLSLCERAKWVHENRIWSNGFVNSYRSSIEKCLIFFMPYRLKSFANDCVDYSSRISFLENFFFCCQLLDDFYDLTEDTEKKTNHNVFFENVPQQYWVSLKSHKLKLLPSLLSMIKKNLTSSDIIKLAAGNEILEYYLKAGTWWVNKKLSHIPGTPLKQIAEQEFKDFHFDESIVLNLLNYHSEVSKDYCLEDIRPEIFQAAYMGKRHIHEV